MDSGKKSISDIFNGNRVLEIPFFQRAYVWGVPQLERFLDDMVNITRNNQPYFLGTIILKQQPTSVSSYVTDVRTIIDGQQRLTTLNIFFKTYALLKKDLLSRVDARFKVEGVEEGESRLAIHHTYNDVKMFEHIMNLQDIENITEKDKISAAYNYFRKHIDIDKLDYQRILNNVVFVCIDVNINEDEQQIFDTINSLGVKLTTSELLKNYLFNRDINSYIKYWQNVFELDEDTKNYWDISIMAGRLQRQLLDIFLYAYLQIKVSDSDSHVSTADKIAFARVENLFESYKKYIENYHINKLTMYTEINMYAKVFKENIDSTIIDKEIPSNACIERINELIFGLDNTTIIPYTLYVLKEQTDIIARNHLFERIESYIVRRLITRDNNKNYNQLFIRCIAQKVLSATEFENVINEYSQIADMYNAVPNDKALHTMIEKNVYTNKIATGILYLLETKIHNSKKHATALLGMEKYSLEHLMPKKWQNNWGNLTEQTDIDHRNELILSIGNLTIIPQSLNASIRDADWQTKKNGKGDKGGLLKFASAIEISRDCLNKEQWTEQDIVNRTEQLYNKIIQYWNWKEDDKDYIGTAVKGKKTSRPAFCFSMVNISVGEKVLFSPSKILVDVATDREISYNGKLYTMSGFCKEFMPQPMQVKSGSYQGPAYFTYNGQSLTALRAEIEETNKI